MLKRVTNEVPLTYNIIKKMRTAKKLFAELNSFDENRRIEAKSASAVGKSMMETVCAFHSISIVNFARK